jgi:GGDEF domain-containing protein
MDTATRSGGTLVILCTLIEDYSAIHKESGSIGCQQAVRETADLLTGCFRRNDYVARLGDAQFATLAVDAAEPSANVLRQRVASRLAVHNQSHQASGPLLLRLSVGYWGANDNRTFPEFLDTVEAELRRHEAVLSGAAGNTAAR